MRSAPPRGWSQRLGLLALLLGLAACSSVEKPKPTPLETLAPRIAGKQVWNRSVGEPIPTGTMLAVRDRLMLATRNGVVLGLDVATGAERERVALGVALSAGIGSDGRTHAVVSEDNELIAIEAGRERWRVRLASRVVSAPLVAGERVFVQGVDRIIEAYDALDGRRLWRLQRQGDPLALAQPGVLTAYKDTLLAGFSAKLLGIDPLLGTVRSELSLASPRCCGAATSAATTAWLPMPTTSTPPMPATASRLGNAAPATWSGTPRNCATAACRRRWRSAARWPSATARAWCTSCRATRASSSCACPPTAARSCSRWCGPA
ncbi:MAG: hypothetical protein RJA44_1523 [Pseudomonadota bacterium]